MVIHLTGTDPTEITVGAAVMAGALVVADMDGVVDMVTTDTDISGKGIGNVFVVQLV